jgi:prepilin-type N-terminal cleavage/methylation domain-containing protein
LARGSEENGTDKGVRHEKPCKRAARGFTLIELLAVIAIISLLIACWCRR